MKIQLLGWDSYGLRCPNLSIDFTIAGRVPKVGLLQMPNGVGKTTTLACLRAAIDGSAAGWNEQTVRDFRPLDTAEDSGSFVVRLLVNDTERLTFEMTFHFEEGIVSYQTTFGKRQSPGFSPPPNVAMFLNPRFARLFIFDGELAKQLLDEQGEDAGRVIDTFYQLYLLEEMKQLAQRELDDHTRHQRSANPAAVDRLDREIKHLDKQLGALNNKADQFRKSQLEATVRIAALETEVGERVRQHEEYRERERNADDEWKRDIHKMEIGLHDLGAALPDPCFIHDAFGHALRRLGGSLDRLKLPDPSSKIFFTELAEEPECICGRALDDDCRAHIRARANDILADETAGFLNALKDDIRHLTSREGASIAEAVAALRAINQQIGDAQQRKDSIRAALASSGDAEIQQRQEELLKRQTDLSTAQDFLNEFKREALPTDRAESGCRKWFERELAGKRKQLAELTGTLDFKQRTDVLKRILGAAYESAHRALKDAVIAAANDRLQSVLKYSPVRIADVASAIRIAGASGAVQGGASVGQTLAIGYVFLTTLLNGAAHQFPLVVDSPAGPMDLTVRREVAPLVPQLCEQFIALTISTEREGFIEPLCTAAQNDVKYLTAFRRTAGAESLIATLPTTGVTQTANGVLVEGRDYFFNFDLEETK